MPDFPRWQQMMNATGGCEQPIRLQGEHFTIDGATGELIESYTTADESGGYLLTACGNRRASHCAACHRRGRDVCEHGRPRGCGIRHDPADPMLGNPICADCYDYPAAVLWNTHAAELWRRLTLAIPKTITVELGSQYDIRPIHISAELEGIADKRVARYIAKYAPKGAKDSGAIQAARRLRTQATQRDSQADEPAVSGRGVEELHYRFKTHVAASATGPSGPDMRPIRAGPAPADRLW